MLVLYHMPVSSVCELGVMLGQSLLGQLMLARHLLLNF